MATYTPNLNLKKPSTGEKYDVVADLNDSKDKIDLATGGVKQRVDTLETDITEIESLLAQKANKDEVTNVMTPKGNIAYASLPTTGNTVGWYYYCPDGDGTNGKGNYVWNGTAWYFGGTGDEGYNKLKDALDNLINNKSQLIVSGADEYSQIPLYLANGTTKEFAGWLSTDFIDCSSYIAIESVGSYYHQDTDAIEYGAFFDGNKNFISTFVDTANYSTNFGKCVSSAPPGAKYLKAYWSNAHSIQPYVKGYIDDCSIVCIDGSTVFANNSVVRWDSAEDYIGTGWNMSDGIKCYGFDTLSYRSYAYTGVVILATLVFYDRNGNIIQKVRGSHKNDMSSLCEGTIQIPPNAYYVKMLNYANGGYVPFLSLNIGKNWKKLNVVCIGDSLTQGYYGADGLPHLEGYPYFLSEKLGKGCGVYNGGVGGSHAIDWWSTYYPNIKPMLNASVNCVVICLGANGGFEDTFESDIDINTNYINNVTGCTCKMVEDIMTTVPNARIILCKVPYIDDVKNPNNAREANYQNERMAKFTERYHMPVLDLRNEMGINKHNSDVYLPGDGLHGNAEYYKRFADLVAGKILSVD